MPFSPPDDFTELSVSEKILYVQDLWDRIQEEVEESPVPEPHRQELLRRLDALEQNPEEGVEWRRALRRLRR